MKPKRNRTDCKFWKPRGKTTHYCNINACDPLKRCFGVCKSFASIKQQDNWIQVLKPEYTNGNYIWVECIAEIKNNSTGEIVEYETEEILDFDSEYPSVFNWEENNYSCDCNRLLFFKRAKNEETEEDFDKECSNGKFSVNLKNKKDGKIYYREF